MERYETKAFGFPLVILNPKWKTRLGQKVLDLNLSLVARELFPLVLKKEGRLTGGEVKFIRTFLDMTQTKFAESIGLSDHSPVSRWEKKPDAITGMDAPQEFTLRVIALKLGGYRIKNEMAENFEKFKDLQSPGRTIEFPSEGIVA